ncbi:MAG: hypothetical protein IJA32_17475 [Lachnospiraceae bacterium]|nr:hypothetical protein [Lachnospiraceae bacterium]
MQITLSSGNYNIIDSGQAFLFDENEDFRIDVDAKDDFKFSMIFKFMTDATKQQQVDKIVKENAIVFNCLNFNDLGTGFSKPMSIAKVDGKEMFLMLWSYLDGREEIGKTRSVKYTIFQEK